MTTLKKPYFYAFALMGAMLLIFSSCKKEEIPILSTTELKEVTQTSAVSGGNITEDGGAIVTERGVCWSTGEYPTIDDAKTTDGTGEGSFSSNITGLEPNMTYFVRSYATNSVGTGYGKTLTFTTLEAIELPTLTTNEVTEITQTTAVSGGSISDDGGATVTAQGVCWSTDEYPTIDDSKTEDGSEGGSFSSNIINLAPNTTYYVRAYATNSEGTGYGGQVSFSTIEETSLPIQIVSPADESFVYDVMPIIFKVNIDADIVRTEFKVNFELHEAFVEIPEEIYLNTNQFEEGATLYLQLKLISKTGQEFNSNIVKVFRSKLTKPILTAEIISNNSIKLFWQDSSNNLEGYRIKRKEGNNDYITIGEVSESIKDFMDNDIDTSLVYSYRVEVYSEYDAILSDALNIEFERNKYKTYNEFNVPESVAGKIAISHDLKKIITTNYYDSGSLIDVETGNIVPVPHPNGSHGLAMSNDGSIFITGGRNPYNIIIWELNSLNIIRQINTQTATWEILLNSENNQVVVGGEPIIIFNIANGNLIKEFSLHSDHFIRGLNFNTDESILLTGGNDDIVKTWDVNSGQIVNTYSGHSGHIGSVCFSEDESKIWSGSYEDHSIRIWNRSNQTVFKTINLNSPIVSLIKGREGDIFAATSDGSIYILDQNGNILDTIVALDYLFDIDYNKNHDVIAAYGLDSLYKVKLFKKIGHWVIHP